MSDLTNFKEKIINRFSSEITDLVFLMIQNDREMMQEYLQLIQNNKQNVVNSIIAKEIKKKYHLENKHLKIKSPKSFLIKSFEIFEND